MPTLYLQVFSMTDHAKPLNDRFKGHYTGLNAELQTSEYADGVLKIAEGTKAQHGDLDKAAVEKAKVIIAYRHSDTGVLTGTSESLLALGKLPWTDMPGFEVTRLLPKDGIQLKLWIQEMKIPAGKVARVHFGKTIVYLKNFGKSDKIQWTGEKLAGGPSQLHAEEIDQDLTVAPPSGSALQVKMGQETEH